MGRILLISVVISFFFYSCKKEISYRMQIMIENTTDNKLTVILYPKAEYMRGDLYNYSELGNGDYDDTSFDIEPTSDHCLFISVNLNQEPYNLVSGIFDSIHIIPFNEDKIEMSFSPDTVIGYSENLFDSNSVWEYEKRNYAEKTSFSSNPIESHNYSYVISTDKY